MNDPPGDRPDEQSNPSDPKAVDSKKVIRQNLTNFLNPKFPLNRPASPPQTDESLKLRMAQMELANKMRLAPGQAPPKAVPIQKTPPPGGFGSAHAVFQMRQTEFGARPSASKPSPYQQILAQASTPKVDSESELDSGAVMEEVTQSKSESPYQEEIIEVPFGSEVRQEEATKGARGKRFRNPSL